MAVTAPGVCRHVARGVCLSAWMYVCTLNASAIPLHYELPSSLAGFYFIALTLKVP